jgi:hypothetical protein
MRVDQIVCDIIYCCLSSPLFLDVAAAVDVVDPLMAIVYVFIYLSIYLLSPFALAVTVVIPPPPRSLFLSQQNQLLLFYTVFSLSLVLG